jgi:hypothetical protein
MTEQTVAVIRKNASDEVRIRLTEYQGHRLVDVRVYARNPGKPEPVPTAKGVALRRELLPVLIEALTAAKNADEQCQ